MKRRQKASFLSARSSKITVTKEKERRKRKSEEKKKSKVTLLVFIIATLEIKKKLFDAKGPIGDNVIKNPARNVRSTIFAFTCHFSISLSAQLKHIYALKCNSTQKDSFER